MFFAISRNQINIAMTGKCSLNKRINQRRFAINKLLSGNQNF